VGPDHFLRGPQDGFGGIDETAVANATETSSQFIGNQLETQIDFTLDKNTTYYWRVDEVNDIQVWPGEVWTLDVLGMPDPVLWWEMDSADDFNLGQNVGGHSGRTYVTNKATGDKASGMTATADVYFDEAQGGLRMQGETGRRIDGEEDPNTIFTSKTQYTYSLFAKGDLTTVTGNGYSFWTTWSDSSRFKCDLSFLPERSACFSAPGSSWMNNAYNIWNTDPAYADRYVNPESWNMYTFVWDSENDFIGTYVNGVLRASIATSVPALSDTITVDSYGFGNWEWASNLPGGWYKDYRVYDTALTVDQIQKVLGDALLYASSPTPVIEQSGLALDTDLSWVNGLETVYQNVYLGKDLSSVINADTTSPEFKAQIGLENTYDPGQLEMYRTYYWRVDQLDENGELIVKGKIWRFSTIESIIVDDFETYDFDGNFIDLTWTDASGSGRIYAELYQDIVQSPINSMRIAYSNMDPPYKSDLIRSFSTAQDWTDGVKVLSLSYYGQSMNSLAQPLYVTIKDTIGGTVTLAHPDPTITTTEEWGTWDIDLTALTGVDLTQVASLTIRLGSGQDEGASFFADYFYIDDIVLYPSRCVAEFGPSADLTGDCLVNYADLNYLAKGWLRGDDSATTLAAANPVGLWLFDDNTDLLKATIGNDLTSDTYNGTGSAITATAGITAGDGAAIVPLNTYLVVDHGIAPAPGQTRVNEYTMVWDVSIPEASAYGPLRWVALGEFDVNDLTSDVDISVIYSSSSTPTDDGSFGIHDNWSDPLVTPDQWYQLVVSVKNGEFFRCYINGELINEVAVQSIDGRYSMDQTFHIFKDNDNEDPDIKCSAFAIFDRALSSEEIAALTPTAIVPQIKGDFSGDSEINFLDYSILADQWMTEILWP